MYPNPRLHLSVLLAALAALLLLAAAPALGQNEKNPPVGTCGLPSGKGSSPPNNSHIYTDVTYNLSGNCLLQGTLRIYGGATVVVNGNGYKITSNSIFDMFDVDYQDARSTPGGVLTLNNLTLDGRYQMAGLVHASGTLTANNVTFRNLWGQTGATALTVYGDHADVNLNSVLFENVYTYYYASSSAGHLGTAINFTQGAGDVTMDRAVFRDNLLFSGAISISGGGSVTANTCLGKYGNLPWTVHQATSSDTFTNNTGGKACTGTIGNKGAAVVAEPALMACGLPGPGTLYTSKTYTQTADCNINTGNAHQNFWRITEGATITFQQAGTTQYTINGGSGNKSSLIWIARGATVNLNSLRMNNLFFRNWGTLNLDGAYVSQSQHRTFNNWGTLNVTNSVFETLTVPGASWDASVMLNIDWYQPTSATVSNTLFSNISGVQQQAGGASAQSGAGAAMGQGFGHIGPAGGPGPGNFGQAGAFGPPAGGAYAGGGASASAQGASAQSTTATGSPALNNWGSASATIDGCTTWNNVLPAKYGATGISDSSVTCTAQYLGPELATFLGLLAPPDYDCLRLGAIGLICRDFSRPLAAVDILGVNPDSSGFLIKRVTQQQVDASPPGLVSASADGRVAVRVWEDRNITVQMGPTDEGKVHHVTLWHNLLGEVAGTIDTYGGPPGLDGLPAVATAAGATAQSGAGAGVHVVTSGETLYDIALRHGIDLYALIELNKLADGGHMIYPGQKLRLPTGDGGVAAPAISDPAPLAKWVTAQEPAEDGTLVHVVQEGDTVWGIAVAYDMEPKTIMELNGFSGHGRGLWLSPGQRLLIRDGKTPPLASVTNT